MKGRRTSSTAREHPSSSSTVAVVTAAAGESLEELDGHTTSGESTGT
jgi:hypothetical protein